MSTVVKYHVVDPEEDGFIDPDDSFFRMVTDRDLSGEYEARDLAEECAMDFYENHCGESYNWPLILIIIGESDEDLGRFSVDIETAPRFSASEA